MVIRRWSWRTKYWLFFLLPAMGLMFAITIYPLFFSFYNSFHGWVLYRTSESRPFVGVEHFVKILTWPRFWWSMGITATFVSLSLCLSLVIGMGLAVLLSRGDIRGKGVIRALLIIPLVLTPVVVGFGFRFMYNAEIGIVPWILRWLGFKIESILGDPKLSLYAVILTDVWNQTPLVFLILLAGLQAIPQEPYEAAQIDGASRWQIFWCITLSALKPAILIALIIRTIDAFKIFDIIYVMTEGGPGTSTMVLSILGYNITFVSFRMGLASAFSLIFLYLIIGLSSIYIYLLSQGRAK